MGVCPAARRSVVTLLLLAMALLSSMETCTARSLQRHLLQQDCFSLDCCEVQCTPPPQPPLYEAGQPYCCPRGTQCRGDASTRQCEAVGGGGAPIEPLTLSEVTVPKVNQYTIGSATSGPNPCNFNGQVWYCPATLNCGRTYLDCLPSANFQELANHGY